VPGTKETFEGDIKAMKKTFMYAISSYESISEDGVHIESIPTLIPEKERQMPLDIQTSTLENSGQAYQALFNVRDKGGMNIIVSIPNVFFSTTLRIYYLHNESLKRIIVDYYPNKNYRDYMTKLIDKKVLQHGKMYDVRDKLFISNVSKYKYNFNTEMSLIRHGRSNDIYHYISDLLFSDTMINHGKIYGLLTQYDNSKCSITYEKSLYTKKVDYEGDIITLESVDDKLVHIY
jgi:hypothetical protein